MENIRKPFQGTMNIIRFNRHFYLLSFIFILIILLYTGFVNKYYSIIGYTVIFLTIATVMISLLVSFYVYDLSNLYKLNWADDLTNNKAANIINIHAGFDETSILLKDKFPNADLIVLDFYDPAKHTEVSIKRARKYYPPYPNTKKISTYDLSVQNNYADIIFVVLSAHEIRNHEERTIFFIELKRTLKENGKIVITEHLRDLPNFLAYNIGFFHFIPKAAWYSAFKHADLVISKEFNITPFITTFILEKNGTTS